MRYAIVINLDYVTFLHEPVKDTYEELQEALLAEGFVRDGRLFIIDCPAEEAQRRARHAIDSVEASHAAKGHTIYPYIKEFFGFEVRHATNLLIPPGSDISVVELADLEGIEGVESIELRGEL